MNRKDLMAKIRAVARKGLVVLSIVVSVGMARAQNGFNIPFSQFGMGSMEQPFNHPLASRMGGAVYTLSGNNYVNPFNPASYGGIETESFVFDMGVCVQTSTQRDPSSRLFDADGNVGYLLMAMPLTKWWKLGAGLMPYTTVNYESVGYGVDPTYFDTVKTSYNGTGGVNQVFLGMAFNLLRGDKHRPDVQLGVNANYLTGRIERAISYTFMHDSNAFYMPKRRYKRTSINNITLDFGLQMRQAIGERYTLHMAAVYKPYMDLKVGDMALVYTYHASDETLVDTIFPRRGDDTEFDSRAERATTIGLGLSLERNKRWLVAFDATYAAWQGLKYTEGQSPSLFGNSAMVYGPNYRYAIGYEKMGNMDASTYWGRISWSAGLHREVGVMRLDLSSFSTEQCINEWGFGMGVSMPMRKGRSLLTLSMGYSSLGTPDLLQRNVLTFGIAVSSCEHWFFKRQYE